ncbi:MAG: GAF domain-containing protein, partial [Anaerolineales bacterium]
MLKRFGALILLLMLLVNKSYVYAGTPIRFGVYYNSPLIIQTPIIFHPIEVRYASGKGANEEILATIDTHLLALKADQDSAYFQSLNTWLGIAETWQMPDWVLWVLAISIFFIIFSLISSYFLRLRVRARTINLEAEISAHKRTEAVLQEKTTQQESMMESAHSLMESLDINEVLERISRHAKKLLNAYGVATYLLERDGETLIPMVAIEPGIEDQILATPLDVQDSYTGQAVIKKRSVIINEPEQDGIGTLIPGTEDIPDERVLVVPFILDGKVYGAMCLNRLGEGFRQEDLGIAETLAVFASTTLKNARDHTRLREEVAKRERAEQKIREYADHLEKMVAERTYDLEQAQKRLIRHEKLAVMDDLAEGIGHELRNPLGVINNAIYYLNMVLPKSNENIRECLELIQSNIQKSTRIVNNLLSFTRIKSVERIPVQVSVLIPSVLAQNPAPDNVTIDVDNCIHLPSVYIGYSQIEQVLGNLLTNAYQAMPDGGHVTLYCEMSSEQSEKPMIAVSVQDTGAGITSENKVKIFEPLFTTKRSGIGLGLAISKRLVEANEGWIDFSSEGIPGKGSKFTIWLPLESEL